MRSSGYVSLVFFGIALCFRSLNASADEGGIVHIGGGEAFGESNRQTVFNGHLYLVSGEPGFLFGDIQDDKGRWHLNYLVLIKHDAKPRSTFAFESPDPSVSSAS